MKIQGKITSAKYRSGTKQNSGDKWECVDYYLVEVNVDRHRSEFPFTLWNDKMKDYALHIGAEGEFDVQVTNEVRNGYNNVKVFVNGFTGTDNGMEKTVGSYASEGQQPNSAANGAQPNVVAQTGGQPYTAANGQANTAAQTGAFDPTNGEFGASGKQEDLPFD